jgi:hypothetical protein
MNNLAACLARSGRNLDEAKDLATRAINGGGVGGSGTTTTPAAPVYTTRSHW